VIQLTLTPEQSAHADRVARDRDARHKTIGTPNKHKLVADVGGRFNRQGMRGEKAVALHYDYPWEGDVGNVGAPDVGPYEVRSIGQRHLSLTLHDTDRSAPFILVLVQDATFTLLGWLWKEEGTKPQYWRTDRRSPAYWVPQRDLHRMETLPPLEELGYERGVYRR
jgi:hypothetical protein